MQGNHPALTTHDSPPEDLLDYQNAEDSIHCWLKLPCACLLPFQRGQEAFPALRTHSLLYISVICCQVAGISSKSSSHDMSSFEAQLRLCRHDSTVSDVSRVVLTTWHPQCASCLVLVYESGVIRRWDVENDFFVDYALYFPLDPVAIQSAGNTGKMRRFLSRIGHFTFSGTENECLFVLQPSHKLYASSLPPLTAADAGELPAGASAADSIAYWKGEATFLIAQSEAAISSLACCGRVLAVGDAHNQLQIWDMKRRITAEALQDRGQTIVHLRNRRVLGYSFLRVACVSANAAASSNSSVAGHGGPDEQPVKHDGYVAAVAVGEFHQALGGQRAAQFIWSVTSHGRLTQWRTSFRAPASYTPTPVPADTWQFEPQLEIVSGSSIPCSPLTDFSGSGHFEPFRAPPLLLRYDADSQLLCAGTQDGHVRVYRTAPEPFVETTQYMLPDSEEDPTRLRLLSVANAPPSGPVVGMSVTTAPPCLDGGAAKHGGEDDPKPLESVIAVACAEGWVHLYGIPASSEGEGALGVRPLHLLQSISAVADQEEEEEEGVEAAMTVSGVSSMTRASGHESSLAAGAGQLIGCCFNAWRDTGPRQADGESAEGPANGALAACSRGGEVMLWPAGELFVDEEESGVVSESAGAGFEIELPESLLEPLDWTAVSEPTSGTEGYNTGEGTTYVQASYTTSSSEGRFEHSATTDPSTTFEAAAGAEAHTTTPSAGQIWGADGSAVATTATTTHTTGSFTSDPAPASSRAALVDWMKTVSSTDNDSLGNSQGAPSLPDTTGLAEATPVPRQLPLWNPSPAPKRPPPTAGPTPSPDRLKPTRTPPTATTSPRRSSPVRAQPSPAPVHPTSTATVPPTSTAATPQEPVSASPRTHPNPARPAEDDKELAYVSSVRVDREWWNPARVAAYLPQADGEAEDDAPSGPSKFENPLAVPSLHSSKLYYQALERAREARLTDSALNAEADKLAEEMIQRHELPDGTTYGRHERVFPPQEPPSQPQPPVVPKAVDGEWLSARELWRPVLPSWMDVMRRATGLQPPTAAGVMPAVGAEAELASLRGLACHPVAAVGGEEWKQVPAVSGPGAARPVVFRR